MNRNGPALALLGLAFGLRLYRLTWLPVSRDEIVTLTRYVPLPPAEILATRYSNNHPLASVLAHLFSPQAGHLFMQRWPFVLLGVLSLALAYRLAVGLAGRRAGLLTLLLLAVAPVHLGYSSIVRGYIGLVSLTTAAFYFLWRAVRVGRWIDWAGFVAAGLLVIYFHLFGSLAVVSGWGLAGLWLAWAYYRPRPGGPPAGLNRARLLQFGGAGLLLLALYALLVPGQTGAVLAEGGYSGEFEAWRRPGSWQEAAGPLAILVGQWGPLSPGGIGGYVYLALAGLGLAVAWRRDGRLALLGLAWFLGPLAFIFGAMRLLGEGFYAYVRFLVYLLPAYLLLVALGFLALAGWLRARAGRAAAGALWLALLGLLLVSLHWYYLRGTNADWPGLASALSGRLQPGDILVCEQAGRGLEAPDRAKPYCLWMLDFFLPQVEEYTPRFQDGLEAVAGADYALAQRAALARPGVVWLVVWQKIIYNVEHLPTAEAPLVQPLPLPAGLEADRAWSFGSARLIRVDTEATLLGNLYQALDLLLRLEPSPAARARYYRSLAELEAVQGRPGPARRFLEQSREMVTQAGRDPAPFLQAAEQVIARVPPAAAPPAAAIPAGYRLDPALCLLAYQVSPAPLPLDRPLALTLYWRSLDFVAADYTFFLSLENAQGQPQGRLEFAPFDRTYPTPWWWPGQLLVERREFVVPPELAGRTYRVGLGAYEPGRPGFERLIPLFSLSSRPGSPEWRFQPEPPANPGCP